MVASLLENGGVSNGTPPETRTDPKNQAESELAKLLFFNRPVRLTAHFAETPVVVESWVRGMSKLLVMEIKVPHRCRIGASWYRRADVWQLLPAA
jgi:hypothetical protein